MSAQAGRHCKSLCDSKFTMRSKFILRCSIFTGPNFLHPHPPHPQNTLLGVGAYERGGAYKNPAAGGSNYTPPPPPPQKCLLAKRGGRGGGGRVEFLPGIFGLAGSFE